ncbi:DUF1045 domain-containing protein [Vannielia litorea]|uniref:DUF1045 domain-containing protein n=1 Tax=Vannielia litorea TaxID=1217970 RepID=UPI001C972AD7|nr:DUF1045 domain-containing protein [Vannielia litorea]MBY6049252.1 DUF1045 domain-containing protein [Vannielia litorea]MBY6076666.1 DUF1045 domain-containing protein [Vannielia litorea]
MNKFSRYAIYYTPPKGPLADFGADWLGWDAETGRDVVQTVVPGLDIAALTQAPRRYGFHGTVKPPFRLVESKDREGLEAALCEVCATTAPVSLDGLRLAALGRFLALVPVGDTRPLSDLAARVVTELDGFRAPPGAAELDRRRQGGLTARQDSLLLRWGYPYVLDEFRFHLTLTGALDALTACRAEVALGSALSQLGLSPFQIRSLCLVGEGDDGRFRLIRRVPLGG